MKETITPAESQPKRLGSYPSSAESTSDQSVLVRTIVWIWKHLLLRRADRSVVRQVAKSKRPRWLFVNVVLCLIFVGPDLVAPFMASQTAWAAPTHLAHQSSPATHLLSQRPAATQCPAVAGQNPTLDSAGSTCTYTPTSTSNTCTAPYTGNAGGPCSTPDPCTAVAGQTPTYDSASQSCKYTPATATCTGGYTGNSGGPCTTNLPACPAVAGQNPTYDTANNDCTYTPGGTIACTGGYTGSPGGPCIAFAPPCPQVDGQPKPTLTGTTCTYTPTGAACTAPYGGPAGGPCAVGPPPCPALQGQNPTYNGSNQTCTYTPSTSIPCATPYTGANGGPCQYFIPTCPAVQGQTPTYDSASNTCSYDRNGKADCATGYTASGHTCTTANLSSSNGQGGSDNFGQDIKDTFQGIVDLFNEIFQIIGTLFKYDFLGWIACMLSGGTIPCPTVSGTAWSFDCPVVDQNDNVIGGQGHETIYQLALNSQATAATTDWLSGDSNTSAAMSTTQASSEPGHLLYTYAADTYARAGIQTLSRLSLAIALTMIGPLLVLAGFQLLMASMRVGMETGVVNVIANATETLGRVLLAGAIVGLSYYVIQILFTLLNTANAAVIALHQDLPYAASQQSINGQTAVSFSVPGDTAQSFRGVVMPMALWGCVMDDFMGILATRVANIVGGGIPIIGGLLKITGTITTIKLVIQDVGEFLLLALSAGLWAQAIGRIILINYYIILAPMAFACWGLPGGTGVKLVKGWFKGFLQLLFMQTVQIFILATMPTILPDFGLMKFPSGGFFGGPLQTLLMQTPPLITALAASGAPKVLMGMGPMDTIAKAGSMTQGVFMGAMKGAAKLLTKK